MKSKGLWVLLLCGLLSCQDPNFGIKNDGVIMIGDNKGSTTQSTVTNTSATISTNSTTTTTSTTTSTTTTTANIQQIRQDIYDELMEYFSTTTTTTSTTTSTTTTTTLWPYTPHVECGDASYGGWSLNSEYLLIDGTYELPVRSYANWPEQANLIAGRLCRPNGRYPIIVYCNRQGIQVKEISSFIENLNLTRFGGRTNWAQVYGSTCPNIPRYSISDIYYPYLIEPDYAYSELYGSYGDHSVTDYTLVFPLIISEFTIQEKNMYWELRNNYTFERLPRYPGREDLSKKYEKEL